MVLITNANVARQTILWMPGLTSVQEWYGLALLLLGSKLRLCDAGTHDAGATHPGCHCGDLGVDELASRPLLVRQCRHRFFSFLPLDHAHIGVHLFILVSPCEGADPEGIAVEAGQCDELPAISQLCKVRAIGLHLLVSQARCIPIERWRLVVRQHEVWEHGQCVLCKLLGLLIPRLACLHPYKVRNLTERLGPLAAELCTPFDTVETLHSPCCFPVEVQIADSQRTSECPHFIEGWLVVDLRMPLGERIARQLRCDEVDEGHALSALRPICRRALGGGIPQGLHVWHSRTFDEGVIPGVNVRIHQCCRLSICSGNNYQRDLHDISLKAGRDDTLDVLLGGD